MSDGVGLTGAIAHFLEDAGLATPDDLNSAVSLTGGVSSDIWKITTSSRIFCVKRARPTLKTAQEWKAPVGRWRNEAEWITEVGQLLPNSVPKILATSPNGVIAMSYFPPEQHRNWKSVLLAGEVSPSIAGEVGRLTGTIHNACARGDLRRKPFDDDAAFDAIRLDPYFRAAARANPALKAALDSLISDIAGTKITLVHGDLTPKNILLGPDGPILLDAECAWFGDPAFDPALAIAHLLLKTTVVDQKAALLNSARALFDGYTRAIGSNPRLGDTPQRVPRLVAAFVLARIDGKSTVEYINSKDIADDVRRFASTCLLRDDLSFDDLTDLWRKERDL